MRDGTAIARTGIGQDSHRFEEGSSKPLVLGGIVLDEAYSLKGNSDSDVILHALTNAVSGITGLPVLGPRADAMCRQGVTDSRFYLKEALLDLAAMGYRVVHASVSIEGRRPKIIPVLSRLRESIAILLAISVSDIGITATTGEDLTAFGKGEGLQAIAIVTALPAK